MSLIRVELYDVLQASTPASPRFVQIPDPSIPSSQAETLAAKSSSPDAYPKNIKKVTPTDSPVYSTFGRTASNASSTRGRPGAGGGSS
ncbi:hypothetical protein AGABI1DRAFT_133418 [Agaricus bisporus var. burnettii JB137-S8]|uniref:Uncharacterized protein n=1 Tax=Agaricus bisporus var. burnettii (strain JB137-S8 / ATCC MYA-4627 / FGSC 10392) TaxID=597362 RepID=K5WUQ2_AGABU|nr:uncharacterized protein AGABI1DRAFT_133418 [Agaricus bisporus var. burnettii JB137-S8]EKM74292.1 hypothetical protein AGABI1DRAFT_133418 [Agaricus bisporus var. burnettii JB137-S8]